MHAQTNGTVLVTRSLHQYATAMDHITALDLFKFYSNELKEVQTIFIGMTFAISIASFGMLIWFMTSDKPYRIISRIKYLRNAFWACLFFMAIAEGRIILYLIGTANKIQTAISSVVPKMDAHLSISAYTYKKISLEMAVWCYALHVVVYALLGYLIWKSKRTVLLADADISKKRSRIKSEIQAAA